MDKIKYGDIFSLGAHRLMCGDCTDKNDIQKILNEDTIDLVFTDPPYGINLLTRTKRTIGKGRKEYAPVIGDNSKEMGKDFYRVIRIFCNAFIIWGGAKFFRYIAAK